MAKNLLKKLDRHPSALREDYLSKIFNGESSLNEAVTEIAEFDENAQLVDIFDNAPALLNRWNQVTPGQKAKVLTVFREKFLKSLPEEFHRAIWRCARKRTAAKA